MVNHKDAGEQGLVTAQRVEASVLNLG
jgi:hypothetical protein